MKVFVLSLWEIISWALKYYDQLNFDSYNSMMGTSLISQNILYSYNSMSDTSHGL